MQFIAQTATHQYTEQNLTVRSGKSEAELTNNGNLRNPLNVLHTILKLTTDRHKVHGTAQHGLSATAGLLVYNSYCTQLVGDGHGQRPTTVALSRHRQTAARHRRRLTGRKNHFL